MINKTEQGKRIPVSFSDAEMQKAYDSGESMDRLLSQYKGSATSQSQPICDEAKERELFEAFAVNRRGGYGNLPLFVFSRKENGQYTDGTAELAWEGWLACAQSRAKAGEAERLRAEVNRLHEAAEFTDAVSQGIEVTLRAQLADACTMLKEIRHHGYHSHKRDGQIDNFLSTIARPEADHE